MNNCTISQDHLRTQKRKGTSWRWGWDTQLISALKGGKIFPTCLEAQTAS